MLFVDIVFSTKTKKPVFFSDSPFIRTDTTTCIHIQSIDQSTNPSIHHHHVHLTRRNPRNDKCVPNHCEEKDVYGQMLANGIPIEAIPFALLEKIAMTLKANVDTVPSLIYLLCEEYHHGPITQNMAASINS
eukprot:528472_1